jgi:hypothetical protein
MNRISSRWIFAVLLCACVVNSRFLLPNSWQAVKVFRDAWGLSNIQRRYLQRGEWYRGILNIDDKVPRRATLRLVSPNPPWYLAYFLYPRLLKKGSEALTDRGKVRKQYPSDWVFVYSEGTPPEMTVYPPLKPEGS